MELSDEVQRGDLATAVLDNPVYVESWDMVRAGIIQAWENAPIRDKEGQNELKLMLKVMTDVRKTIEQTMQTGKLAKIQIEQEGLVSRIFKRG